jgi:hypothetical protein
LCSKVLKTPLCIFRSGFHGIGSSSTLGHSFIQSGLFRPKLCDLRLQILETLGLEAKSIYRRRYRGLLATQRVHIAL